MSKKLEEYEVITLFRGRDSATYLLSEFEKYGENAEPLFVRQNPSENAPFKKIYLKDTDGFMKHKDLRVAKSTKLRRYKMKNWVRDKLFWLKTGIKTETFNNGQPVKEHIIRFKDIYITVLEGDSDYNVSYSYSPSDYTPIREYYEAKK